HRLSWIAWADWLSATSTCRYRRHGARRYCVTALGVLSGFGEYQRRDLPPPRDQAPAERGAGPVLPRRDGLPDPGARLTERRRPSSRTRAAAYVMDMCRDCQSRCVESVVSRDCCTV